MTNFIKNYMKGLQQNLTEDVINGKLVSAILNCLCKGTLNTYTLEKKLLQVFGKFAKVCHKFFYLVIFIV